MIFTKYYDCYLILDFIFIFKTALHWAAKHGNMDMVKMLAGTYGANVNVKTVSIAYFINICVNPPVKKIVRG